MVEYNEFHGVKSFLKEEYGKDVASIVFDYLYVFIKDWHTTATRTSRLWLEPSPYLGINNKWCPAIMTYRPCEISFTTTEQFYKMRKMDFKLVFYLPTLFSPPYSDLFVEWQKELGTERAKELMARYSYDTNSLYRFHTDVFGWTTEACDAHEKEIYAELENVTLDFELTEMEKTEVNPPCTILVKNEQKFYDAVQKLRKKAYKPRIRKRKQPSVRREPCPWRTGLRPLKELRDKL